MAQSEIHTTVVIKLTITVDEAIFIKDLLQNPRTENEDNYTNIKRSALFNVINAAVQKAKGN